MRRSTDLRLATIGLPLLLASALVTGAEARTPVVDLVWSDPYGLFPRGARDVLRDEVARFSSVIGISLGVVVLGESAAETLAGAPRIYVTLRPGGARHWGLEDQVMAVSVGERGGGHAVFVFVDAVRRTLGQHSAKFSPRNRVELTRALARVVEHELVHVLAPDRGHAVSGLMSRQLTRKLLLKRRIELDLTSLVRARAGALRIANPGSLEVARRRSSLCPAFVAVGPPPPAL